MLPMVRRVRWVVILRIMVLLIAGFAFGHIFLLAKGFVWNHFFAAIVETGIIFLLSIAADWLEDSGALQSTGDH